MDNIKEKLKKLVLDPMLKKLELQLREPNIFYILRIEYAEIRHSNFLAWLLKPKQNHGLGDILVLWTLRSCFNIVTILNRKRGAIGNTKYAYVKEPYYVYSTKKQ